MSEPVDKDFTVCCSCLSVTGHELTITRSVMLEANIATYHPLWSDKGRQPPSEAHTGQ